MHTTRQTLPSMEKITLLYEYENSFNKWQCVMSDSEGSFSDNEGSERSFAESEAEEAKSGSEEEPEKEEEPEGEDLVSEDIYDDRLKKMDNRVSTRLALCVEANPLMLEANFDMMRPWSDIFGHEGNESNTLTNDNHEYIKASDGSRYYGSSPISMV
ncbi:hypothetical protein GQR58_002468 [Nymphon striatum]|nr:hypothetical protein GQR58_002468 [Nymphon striatum]